MANYCFTNYCIEGNKSSLTKIANAINFTDGYVDNIFKILDEELEIQDYSQWCDAEVIDKDDYSVLMFREENKWRRSENIDRLLSLEEYGQDTKVYFLSQVFESEEHWTNDAEGKYFSMRYNVCIDNGLGGYAYADIDTEQDVVKFCKNHNIEVPQDSKTIEEIRDFCSNNDIEFSCCDIMIRDDHGVITDEVMQQIHVSVEKHIQ